MTATFALGVENACDDSGATDHGGYVTAVDEATGYPASNLLLEAPAAYWRSTARTAGVLTRFGRERLVGSLVAGPHVGSRHSRWRWATGTAEEPAIRPAASFDGVDDYGVTATTIPASADITVYCSFWAPSQPTDGNTSNLRIWKLESALGIRFSAVIFNAGAGALAGTIGCIINNAGAGVSLGSTVIANGAPHRMAVRYRDSDQRTELWIDGVSMGAVTASAVWPGGADALEVGRLLTKYCRVVIQDIRISGAYDSDATIIAYDGAIQTGTENNLLGSWHFLEGTSTAVADSTGTSNMTLTGATWVTGERVNPWAEWAGERAVWGPWKSRRGIDLSNGVTGTSPSLGTYPRSATLAFTMVWPANAVPADEIIVRIGTAAGASLIRINTNASGKVYAVSFRGGTFTVTSDSTLNDGLPHHIRATINGITDTLTLYVGSSGVAEASEGTPQTTGVMTTIADILVAFGGAKVVLSDVRYYDEVVLEADDPMSEATSSWRRGAKALIDFEGQVLDGVDPARVYTLVGTPSYKWIHDDTGLLDQLGGTDSRQVATGADPYAGYQHLLAALADADVSISEVWVQMYDPSGPGYVQIGTLHAAAAERPPTGVDLEGQVRRHTAPAVVRSARSGAVALGEGYTAWGYTGRLRITSGRTTATLLTDAQEFEARLVRRADPSRLVAVWALPKTTVPVYRLIEHVVVGIYKPEAGSVTDVVFDSFPIVVDGVL